jgi:hypothetical protein
MHSGRAVGRLLGPSGGPNAIRPQGAIQGAILPRMAAELQTNKIVCVGQEAGLTIPRRLPSWMPSGPTAQIVAAPEEMNM